MNKFVIFSFCIYASCAPTRIWSSGRVILAKSETDQSCIIDTNGDQVPDVERWYRGSQIAYEKIDNDYDGYWDVQGRRRSDGAFDIYYNYPERKYRVMSHHIFYATKEHPVDVTILARLHK
ncbi:MAG: hypothetical protein ABI162_16365 [Luteolibacter sp.]